MISLPKQHDLRLWMETLGVREQDLEESFIRSSGPGGQKVNKSSSCVLLKHLPTGIEVKCQRERSQSLNRFFARRLLLEKLAERRLGEKSAKRQAIEKIRRQKRKRSARAKEKMLENKKHRAEVKKTRQKIKA